MNRYYKMNKKEWIGITRWIKRNEQVLQDEWKGMNRYYKMNKKQWIGITRWMKRNE